MLFEKKEKKKALIIENSYNEAKNCGHILNRYYDMEVKICTKPVDAVAAAMQLNPNLIIMELDFYKINGLDILEAIRDFEQFKDTPVVIISRSRKEETIKQAYQYGIKHYFTKPLDKMYFDKKIEQIILDIR